jgi:hypothetical protein
MNSLTSKRRFSASLFAFLAAAAMPLAAAAGQPGAGPGPGPSPNANPGPGLPYEKVPYLTVECCHCTGEKSSQRIDTGVPGGAPWTVNPGGMPVSHLAYPIATATLPPWTPPAVTSPSSSWVGPTPTSNWFAPPGVYTYRLRILLPAGCFIPAKYEFDGRFWADDTVTMAVSYPTLTYISGGITSPTPSPAWVNAGIVNAMTFSGSGFIDLIFTVHNRPNGVGNHRPTGFLFQGTLTKRCATDSGHHHPPIGPISQPVDGTIGKPIDPQVDVPIDVPSPVSGQPSTTMRRQYN